MVIGLRLVGIDDWDREVYKDANSEKIYKKHMDEKEFYTASSFDGEPISLVGKDIELIELSDGFSPKSERYQQYAGIGFSLIGEIDAAENYSEDMRMFTIRLNNGKEIPAFKEEIQLQGNITYN